MHNSVKLPKFEKIPGGVMQPHPRGASARLLPKPEKYLYTLNLMSQNISLKDAVAKVKDGMTIMVGGFLANGSADTILQALAESGVKDLTIICNDTGYPDKGVGRLLNNGQVKKLIASYIGATPIAVEQMNNGTLEVEFSPQGTLAERIRSGGFGLGGVLTPTGLGTIVAEGKEIVNVDGKDYLLEKPLKADMALIGATTADEDGNLIYKGTSRNFNPLMAMAADVVICEAEERVPTGSIEPENVHTPSIFVDYILER